MSIKFLSGIDVDSNTLFVDAANNRVGVGTASPAEKLDVNGNVKVGTRLAMTPSVFGYSSGWKTLILGSSGTDYTTNATTITFGVDLSTNPSGSYTGNGGEIFFRNQVSFGTPNAANDGYLYPMGFNNGTVFFTAGNVLLNTTTDTGYRLNVVGEVSFSPNTAGKNTFTFTTNAANDARLLLKSDTTTKVDIQANGTTYFNGGNVGIGTTSPVTKLNLKESNTGTEGFIITNWNNVNTLLLGSDFATGGGKLTLQTNAGTSNVFISSYSNSYFNGGNVGIGTTTDAGYKLDVSGTGRFSDSLLVTKTTTGTGLGDGIIITLKNPSTTNNTRSAISFGNIDNVGSALAIQSAILKNSTTGEFDMSWDLYGGAAGWREGLLYLDSNPGNIGINTNFSGINTASLLTIKASDGEGKQIYIVQSNDDRGWRFKAKIDGHFYLDSAYSSADQNVLVARYDTGNVLIGTTTDAGYKLDVSGTGRFTGLITGQAGIYQTNASLSIASNKFETYNGGATDMNFSYPASGSVTFTNGTPRLTIASTGAATFSSTLRSGNVGINTAPTASALRVVQNANDEWTAGFSNNNVLAYGVYIDNSAAPANTVSAFQVYTPSGTGFRISNNGNAQLGTFTDAGYKLDVSGSARISSANGLVIDGFNSNTGLRLNYGNASGEISVINILANGITNGYIGIQMVDSSNGDLWFGGSGNRAMTVYRNGNVGIGTTSPAAKLDITIPSTFNTPGLFAQSGINLLDPTNLGAYSQITFGYTPSRTYAAAYFGYVSMNSGSGGYGDLVFGTRSVTTNTQPSERMRIVSNGNVLIGTTTDNGDKLQVAGQTTINGSLYLRGGSRSIVGDGGDLLIDTENVAGRDILLQTQSGQKVGIGTTSPLGKFDVYRPAGASGTAAIVISNGEASGKNWAISTEVVDGGDFALLQSATTGGTPVPTAANVRFIINNAGNVGIGTTSPSEKLHVVGTGYFTSFVGIADTTTSSWGLAVGTPVGADGAIKTTGSVQINSGALAVGSITASATAGRIDASNDIVAYSTSDSRLKENITPIANALDKVKSLTGVEFDWKEETKHVHGYEGHDVGVIAQEVQAVLPEAIRTNDSGYLSVRYEKMIALLIEGMKEQQNQIDELKAKLDGLTK